MQGDWSFKKIKSFMLVAELRSFRRAAERIHISPPALSTHIRDLEAALGVPLLYRTTRSVELTDEGERLLERVRPLFASLSSVIDEFHEEANLLRGRLTIACLPSIVSKILLQPIKAITERHPAISIRILDLGYSSMVEAIQSGDADVGIGPVPDKDARFDITPLMKDGFVALVPAGHPLAKKNKVTLAQLAKFPIIGRKVGTSIRDALERAAAEMGIKLDISHELIYHHSVGCMVQANLGVTALPATSLPTLNFPGTVAVPIFAPNLVRTIGIIRRKGGGASPAVREFLAVLSKSIADTPDVWMGDSRKTENVPCTQRALIN
jgi:LysR family carnitine catabolism transcriptional activator